VLGGKSTERPEQTESSYSFRVLRYQISCWFYSRAFKMNEMHSSPSHTTAVALRVRGGLRTSREVERTRDVFVGVSRG